MVETQAGENEGMRQDDNKILVGERESKEIDAVMNCKGKFMAADRGFKVKDDLTLCGAHLALPAFTRRNSHLSREDLEKSSSWLEYAFMLSKLMVKCRRSAS